ncbi:MAG: porin family protein [Deltaproteobacteria bacterium]|nr:porin family protein [Deltaproteobacteria bacterium]
MKTTLMALGTLAALLLGSPLELRAEPADAGQKILVKKKKVVKKRAVRRRAPAPYHVRRYVPAGAPVVRPVVVHRRPVLVPAHSVAVVHRHHRRTVVEEPAGDDRVSIGLRALGATVDGEMLNLAAVENPAMGGLGLQIRGKVSDYFGLELGVDWLRGGDGTEVVQTTVPLMLSAYVQFFPHSRFRPLLLAGMGVHFTKLEYAGGFRYDTAQLAMQLGGGLEVKLTDWFGLTADVRFLGLYRDLGAQSSLERDCIRSMGSTFCSGLRELDTSDRWNIGAQFMAGAAFYF